MHRLLKRSFSSQCKVDADGLPLAPTWTVKSLLPNNSQPTNINQDRLDHLCRLAQLLPRTDATLIKDMNDLSHFVDTIQQPSATADLAPLIHIWDARQNLAVRPDSPVSTDGHALLSNAKKTHGNYYTIADSPRKNQE
ncbi:hypothetical protein DM01DRAFT_1403149 [Hesseltinella vesiculosa]|uniref:Glutamyl-tRNA(Gln) amidotransferase subunit C, mitochondrial n=1 Tax=Hesseltinella vesiculosa TaxID=101127 RepID=A0A1X2GYG8_9FUNG|nr:hypothetical protein DM01DRAFT_1403149 [Hesseltinella vesiculosa]